MALSIGPVTFAKVCGVTKYGARGGRVIPRTIQTVTLTSASTIKRTIGKKAFAIRLEIFRLGDISAVIITRAGVWQIRFFAMGLNPAQVTAHDPAGLPGAFVIFRRIDVEKEIFGPRQIRERIKLHPPGPYGRKQSSRRVFAGAYQRFNFFEAGFSPIKGTKRLGSQIILNWYDGVKHVFGFRGNLRQPR